ncbi:MAG: hypothetical protein RL701_3133 [Pseudomonadota bacterium]|jgi:hypothetical protein
MQASSAATSLTPPNSDTTGSGPVPKAPAAPPLTELEDLLYDLLDCGPADPSLGQEKLAAIRAFLHEHARERKSHAQFVTFFEDHTLSMQPERPNALAMPMNSARHMPVDDALALEFATPSAEPEVEAEIVTEPEPLPVAAMSRKPSQRWIWALGCAAVCGIIALVAASIISMRDEIARLNTQVISSAQRLEQLRSETDRLKVSVEDSHRTEQRTEHDTQPPVPSALDPVDTNSR